MPAQRGRRISNIKKRSYELDSAVATHHPCRHLLEIIHWCSIKSAKHGIVFSKKHVWKMAVENDPHRSKRPEQQYWCRNLVKPTQQFIRRDNEEQLRTKLGKAYIDSARSRSNKLLQYAYLIDDDECDIPLVHQQSNLRNKLFIFFRSRCLCWAVNSRGSFPPFSQVSVNSEP